MPKKQTDSQLLAQLSRQFTDADNDLTNVRDTGFTWYEREQMLMGELADQGTKGTKSQVTTNDLMNLVFDGAARTMAQLPTGTIQADSEDDKGKNLLMQLVDDKYIMPNANAQWDFHVKLRIWNIYSRIFGSMPALVDWRVSEDYVGPDLWLIHPRSFFPQAGCTSIDQMQYCFVDSWVSVEWLKDRDPKVWKNVKTLIEKAKQGGESKQQLDSKYQPINLINTQQMTEKGNYAQVLLRTRYEKNRWVTYAPTYNLIARDISNPQGNNQLPIVMKHCFPLIDRLYGLGDIERGFTLQYAVNSLVNMYLDGVRMSIFPPTILDVNKVVASSIEMKANAKWLTTAEGAVEQLPVSPQGLKTFTSTYGFMKLAINNVGGTTDTIQLNPDAKGLGKSPAAIKKQQARENTRDNWDRFMMEQAIEEVKNRFIALLSHKQEKPIELTVFEGDIKKIQETYQGENVLDGLLSIYSSEKAGKVTIPADTWKDGKKIVPFKYTIDKGSTKKTNEEAEYDALTEMFGLVLKEFPELKQSILQTGKAQLGDKVFDFGYALKRWTIASGMQDADKIITDAKQGDAQQMNEQQEIMQLKQQVEQLAKMMQMVAQKIVPQPQNAPPVQPMQPNQPAPAPMGQPMAQ